MRTITATLEAAQQALHRRPHVEALVHDLEQGVGRLIWERIYTGSEPESHHDIAFDGSGRMHRIRVEGTYLYRQRIPAPDAGSTYSSWSLITTGCAGPCAIAASGDKVYIFYRTTGNVIAYYYSHNGGTTWNIDTLASYADVISMAAAWWTGGSGDNVVCFTLRTDELSAIVWDTDTDTLVVQRIVTFTAPHTHIITNTYGIGATYSDADVRAHIVFAGRRETTPYNTYELFRTQLSPTHYFSALESFVVSPEDPLDADLLRHEYPDCHVPASAAAYEPHRITMVEKFTGPDPYDRPIGCHVVRGTSWMDAAYTEPCPLVDTSSDYGLRLATNATHWWLSRPDGIWWAPRTPLASIDLSPHIVSLELRSHAVASSELYSGPGTLVLELDNSQGQYADPGTGVLASLRFRAELELRLGYHTTSVSLSPETVQVGRYWIDGWEHNSVGLRSRQRAGRRTFTLYCLDGWSLANRWTPRYQLRWNHNGTPHNVWQILYRILARVGIRLVTGPPRSSPMLNFYPDFTLVPGQRGDAVIRRLLATVPDQLVFDGQEAWVKDIDPGEATSYEYGGSGEHLLQAGKYGEAVTASRTRAIGRDDTVTPPDQIIADEIDWDLQQLYDMLRVDYDPRLATYAEAVARAQAMLRSLSLEARSTEILVPTNVAQELLDVIEVTDQRCGIVSERFRVKHLLIQYNWRIGRYEETLTLGAP